MPDAMISSTALDLPEHRRIAIDSCLREGFLPLAMEHLPARDATAVAVSLEMVDRAQVYIVILGWRYGWIPPGQQKSITELEFDRALERKASGNLWEVLVFIMHDEHPTTRRDVEADALAQQRLEAFKSRAAQGRVRVEFASAEELRSQIIQALSECRQRRATVTIGTTAPTLHATVNIPKAPHPYVAHPYTLLETRNLIGRKDELKRLNDWLATDLTNSAAPAVFCLVGLGGMGKSALMWKWFEEIIPTTRPDIVGSIWWSFYDGDAQFEAFVDRALAYVSGTSLIELRQLPFSERQDLLLSSLDARSFVVVLDGIERLLVAYARADASHLLDDNIDENSPGDPGRLTGVPGPTSPMPAPTKHRLRQCSDPRVGSFLRRLTRLRLSRVLISTRLIPAELQTLTGQSLPGTTSFELSGLTDIDALALWSSFVGQRPLASTEELLRVFNSFSNYPLLLRALAGAVAEYHPAPGDFAKWREDFSDFNPATLPLATAKTHVLHFALKGLNERQHRTLHTLSAFRMPAGWDTVRTLLVGKGKPCESEPALDSVLTQLEDRGLVGWDRRANRYDLHPIVRAVVWAGLTREGRRDQYSALQGYFGAIPPVPEDKIEQLQDLAPAIELFQTLIGLELFDDAWQLFQDRLSKVMHNRLSASPERIVLLHALFPDGLSKGPRVRRRSQRAWAYQALGESYLQSGRPHLAATLIENTLALAGEDPTARLRLAALHDLSDAYCESGALYQSEICARGALGIARKLSHPYWEPVSLGYLGRVLTARGVVPEATAALMRARHLFQVSGKTRSEGVACALLADLYLECGNPRDAAAFGEDAKRLAQVLGVQRDVIRALRLEGMCALLLGRDDAANALREAVSRAREVSFVEEELPASIALAEFLRRLRKYDDAREILEGVWRPAHDGPYPLYHADALNVLARVERDTGSREGAVAVAAQAFRLAWCDGPPFSYRRGLAEATRHLSELEAAMPELSPFDANGRPPLPAVRIDSGP